MQQIYDKKWTERVFNVGDWVYLKLQPYHQQSVVARQFNKLAPKYYGPFQVQERIGIMVYRLNLPPDSKIHLVFHVSLLKKKRGDVISPIPILPPLDAIGVLHWQLEAVLDRCMFKKKNDAVTKWLIKWAGLPTKDATWEEANAIITRYPNFKTWGHALYQAGIVRTCPLGLTLISQHWPFYVNNCLVLFSSLIPQALGTTQLSWRLPIS